ncbi:hypothetical protein [Nocardia sp. NPDC052566]|uniref:hypothetical protein n=1 Tax=Nocardia sp. NPDC052566 TaxID=3364330 RepID=UPI0037C9130D
MTTVVFVHGTGVRRASFEDTFAAVSENLTHIRPGFRVTPCYWGDVCGARLNLDGASIPLGYSSRAGDTWSDDDPALALWALLESDPLYELRHASPGRVPETPMPPNAPLPGRQLANAARNLTDDAAVVDAARAAGVAPVLGPAIDGVIASPEYARSVIHAAALGAELIKVLARAIVAAATVRMDRRLDGVLALDGAHRDELAACIVAGLGGSDRGMGKLVVDVALATGITKPAERRRAAISNAFAPLAGDVVLYLTRGNPLRAYLFHTVTELAQTYPGEDIIVLAHSLGGIAVVDMLITRALPQVSLLITVGSQAPLLYELNALPTLEFGAPLPAHMPPWVNIYDRRDLLGYAAEPVFPNHTVDRTVDNNTPFPRSHSAYFRRQNFFDVLDEVLP